MKSAKQAFMQKLAAGWVAPSSTLPAMDAGLAQATTKGMQGSTPAGTVVGRGKATAVKMDKAPKAPKVKPRMDKGGEGKIPASELKKGIEVEKEHKGTVGNDPAKFKSIAKDHLRERPDYYTQLARMEAKPVENTMKDAEIKGFISKCAELGVDPTVAIKYAQVPYAARWWNPGYWPLGLINGIINKAQTGRWGGASAPAKPILNNRTLSAQGPIASRTQLTNEAIDGK